MVDIIDRGRGDGSVGVVRNGCKGWGEGMGEEIEVELLKDCM